MELFDATLHFFCTFVERHPPPGCPRGDWDALTRAAGRLFDRSADLSGADPARSAALLDRLARECARCYRILRRMDAAVRPRGAIRQLDCVAAAIEASVAAALELRDGAPRSARDGRPGTGAVDVERIADDLSAP